MTTQRLDDLMEEYLKILAILQTRIQWFNDAPDMESKVLYAEMVNNWTGILGGISAQMVMKNT